MSERLKLFTFGCIVLGGSLAGTLVALGARLEGRAATLFGTLYMAAPMIVAIAITRTRFKAPLGDTLGFRFKPSVWIFVGWLAAVPIALVGFGIAAAAPEAHVASGLPWVAFLAMVPVTGWFALLALPQEAAWRGFVLGALRPSFPRAWLVTGIASGLWQLPLELLEHSPVPLWVRIGSSFGFAFFATPLALLVRLRAGSTIASAVCIGALHATASAVRAATQIDAPVFLVPLAIVAALIATRETGTRTPSKSA